MMDKRLLAIIAGGVTIALTGSAILVGVLLGNNTDQSPQLTSAGPAYCYKAGENFASINATFDVASANQKASDLGMGHTLVIAEGYDQNSDFSYRAIRDALAEATRRGITPILRLCVGGSCGFSDVNVLNSLLLRLSNDSEVSGDFYVIAGPNEPNSEPWLGGSPGNPDTAALANYMNNVINNSGNLPKVRLLSPAFNSTHPNFENTINGMNAAGANWAGLDAIALNAYNVSGYFIGGNSLQTVTEQLQRVKNAIPGRQYMITETGMYESERNLDPIKSTPDISHSQSLVNFRNQVTQLQSDSSVLGFLLFNSFGINSDGNFQYNVMNDSEFAQVLGSECIGSGGSTQPTQTVGSCPASVGTIFIIDGDLSGQNETTNAEIPINSIRVAATTNGGASFNNFNGELRVSGSENGTFSGMSTSDLLGPFESGDSITLQAYAGNDLCASSTLNIFGDNPSTDVPNGCPAQLATVFVVDGDVSDQNATTNVDAPVNSVRIAASTTNGSTFNNFNGELRLTGSENGTFSGNSTSDLLGPFNSGNTYVVSAYVGNTLCTTSTLNITGSPVVTTTVEPTTTSPTVTVVTTTTAPTSVTSPTTVVSTTTPTSTAISPTSSTDNNENGGITGGNSSGGSNSGVNQIPNTALGDSLNPGILIGVTLFVLGTFFYFASDKKVD